MSPRARLGLLMCAAALATACGGAPPTPPVATAPAAARAATAAASAAVAGRTMATAAPAAAAPVKAAAPAVPAPAKSDAAGGALGQQTTEVARAAADVLTPATPRYAVRGRRDPFESLEVLLQERQSASSTSLVSSSKLTGIIRGWQGMLALLETAQGMGYILKPGDALGDGRLVEIGADQVVFSVAPKPGITTNRVVLKIAKD